MTAIYLKTMLKLRVEETKPKIVSITILLLLFLDICYLGSQRPAFALCQLPEYGYQKVDRGRFSGHATPVNCRNAFSSVFTSLSLVCQMHPSPRLKIRRCFSM